MTGHLEITKLDAARRQLETAVDLYFHEGDPVAIHTLTAAAHQLLSDLARTTPDPRTLTDSVLNIVVAPSMQKEARRIIRSASNFMKHAERDPEASFSLLLSQSEFLLFDGVHLHRRLTGRIVPVLGVYSAWFWLGPGKDFVDVSDTKTIDRFRTLFPQTTRASFYAAAIEMLSHVP